MKSKKTIVRIAIISIVLGSICIGMGLVMGGNFHALQISMGVDSDGFYFRNYEDVEFENNTLKDVTSLIVEMNLGSITIVEEDRDDIQIVNAVKGQYTLNIKDSKAILKTNTKRGFSFFNFGNEYSQDIEILVPRDFEFDYLKIHNLMGDIDVSDIKAKQLDVEVDLGDFEGENLQTGNLVLDNAMGNIKIDGVFLNKSSIHNDLGDIDVQVNDDIENYDYQAECSLGSVKVNGRDGATRRENDSENMIEISNKLGDITLDFSK